MTIEIFNAADAEDLWRHSQSIGWYELSDWHCFLRHGRVLGHRDSDGRIVSSASYLELDRHLAWIGAFVVNPDCQGRGLGAALLERCLGLRGPDTVVGLVSTTEGRGLYERGGFQTVASSHKFVIEAGGTAGHPSFNGPNQGRAATSRLRTATEADLPEIVRLDQRVMGLDRSRLLADRLQAAPLSLVLSGPGGEVVGFALGALDGTRTIAGPVVAPDAAEAMRLTTALAGMAAGGARIDVPSWQTGLIGLLPSQGFQLERECPIMTLRGAGLPRESSQCFALLSQALG